MATIFEYLPGVLAGGLIVLVAWMIFGQNSNAKPSARRREKQNFYRWDDRSAHRD